jgi:hypothetical protein
MSGAMPPVPNTPSWSGTQLKKSQGQLYLYLSNKLAPWRRVLLEKLVVIEPIMELKNSLPCS